MAAGRGLTVESGTRGYKRYLFGTHYWIPDVQSDWSRGMVRDVARTEIPANGAYDIADYLVHVPGQLIKRGHTVGGGSTATGNYLTAVAYADYPAGAKLIAVNEIGHIFNAGTTTDLGGSTVTTIDTPKFRVGGAKNLLVFPQSNGTAAPIKYDGTAAPALLAGTPAFGRFAALYKTRLALGCPNANPNRVYFSPTPDIEATWDTANSWIDCDHAITGLAALQNALLVFSRGSCERIIGSTPPPNTDMDRQPIGDIGCADARSIVVYRGNAIFANADGVYRTNGVSFESLTEKGGIGSYWRSRFNPLSFDPATWVLSAGVFADWLFVNLLDNTGVQQISLLCYLPTLAWVRTTNIKATMFAYAPALSELYYAPRDNTIVPKLSPVFADTGQLPTDFNSVAVQPVWETRSFGGNASEKAWGDVTADVDFLDTHVGGPSNIQATMAVGALGGTYAAIPGSPLVATAAGTAALQTYQMSANVNDRWVSFIFTQNGQSDRTIWRQLAVSNRSYTLSHTAGVE